MNSRIEQTVKPGATEVKIEFPYEHVDGSRRVWVEWEEAESSWIARTTPGFKNCAGCDVAYGATQMEALAELVCSLAATVEAMNA